jgi:hypothetical protein
LGNSKGEIGVKERGEKAGEVKIKVERADDTFSSF